MPSPSASSGSSRDRMVSTGMASIKPTPNTGGGMRKERSTSKGQHFAGAPGMALSWCWAPPLSRAKSSPSLKRKNPTAGVPRPSPGWQPSQLVLLKMGPRPSSMVKALAKFSSPATKTALRSADRPSKGDSKSSPAGGGSVISWPQAPPIQATAHRTAAKIGRFI